MTGKPDWPRSFAAAPSLVKRPALLAGIAILALAAAATGAWVTRPPETAPPRIAKSAKSKRTVPQVPTPPATAAAGSTDATPAASIPPPETPPPPEPGAADFARNGAAPAAEPAKPVDWATIPIDELRTRANADEIPAMEELARRLVQGAGVTKDQQAGAGWLLRAAQRGSAQSAFNVAVMYERGFVVERDSTKAIDWYRKAVAANMPTAKHNLALLLREGKGAPRNGKEAVELLRSAARQGMAASMFTLGDIYERGDAAPKDQSAALAWFAITAEFERQTNRDTETPLAKTATQRTQTLQRILTPAELERAQQLGQAEFKLIVEALSPPKPPPAAAATPPAEDAAPPPPPPPPEADPPGWPKATNDQIRVVQQALVDLKFLRDKPDGIIGPMTRTAIRAFQRSVAMRETGEPTRDVYAALRTALASRDIVANSPLPPMPKPEAKAEIPPAQAPQPEPEKVEAATAEAAKAEAAKAEVAKAEAAKAEAAKAEAARIEAAKAEAAKAEAARIEAAKAEAAKAEAAKAEAAKAEAARIEAAKAEAAKAEAAKAEAAKAEATRIEAAKAEAAKAEAAKAEAAKAEAARIERAKVDPPKPPMPKIETEKPPMPQVASAANPSDTSARSTTINIGNPPPAPPPPTSADIGRIQPQGTPKPATTTPVVLAWPATTTEQVKVIQKLLRDLNFTRDAPDGLNGPGTRAAIRDFERAAGLAVTGEPSKALFEALNELHVLVVPKAN